MRSEKLFRSPSVLSVLLSLGLGGCVVSGAGGVLSPADLDAAAVSFASSLFSSVMPNDFARWIVVDSTMGDWARIGAASTAMHANVVITAQVKRMVVPAKPPGHLLPTRGIMARLKRQSAGPV